MLDTDNIRNLHSICNIKMMEVIDISTGAKLGMVKDFIVSPDSSKIEAIVMPGEKTSWLSKSNDIIIQWEDVEKVGMDVILINGENYFHELKNK